MENLYGKQVSIVVPVYNVELYLRQCLDSLIGQTYKNIEILLIDDGSTDMSGAICDMYGEQDIRIKVFHKENGGVSSARNMGINMASSEYLLFVDADDMVHREWVELYMRKFREDRILVCDCIRDMNLKEKTYYNECGMETEEVRYESFMQMFYRDYINPPFNKLYMAAIIKGKKIYFPEEKSLGEDLVFNLEYLKHVKKNYCIIHYPLYYYRENRRGSLSNSYKADLFELQQESFAIIKNFLQNAKIWNEENQKIYFGMFWERLYMTAKIYQAYEKTHPDEKSLSKIIDSPIWQKVWRECKKMKILTWKRRVKRLYLCCLFFMRRR